MSMACIFIGGCSQWFIKSFALRHRRKPINFAAGKPEPPVTPGEPARLKMTKRAAACADASAAGRLEWPDMAC